jgi:hypothetical protein
MDFLFAYWDVLIGFIVGLVLWVVVIVIMVFRQLQ